MPRTQFFRVVICDTNWARPSATGLTMLAIAIHYTVLIMQLSTMIALFLIFVIGCLSAQGFDRSLFAGRNRDE
jgi:uncharacterized membrane protein (DUF4010 family)